MKTSDTDKAAARSDILTTLAICALIHETNEAVRACAKRLIERAPRSICKNTLYPLSESRQALDIIIDEVVYPTEEMVIGKVTLNNYEYELVVIYREVLEYDVKQIVDLVVQLFVQRGIVSGRLYMSFRYLFRRGYFDHSVDMDQASRYSAQAQNAA